MGAYCFNIVENSIIFNIYILYLNITIKIFLPNNYIYN